MGNYSKSITNRFQHTKINEGYCVICGTFGKLSPDHVPPKGSISVTKTEQRHITEMMGAKSVKVKGITSTNGSKFKTICHRCNNYHLGQHDHLISEVNKQLTLQINAHILNPSNNIVSASVSALGYARAMVGHILAATSVSECKKPIASSPYFDPLRQFVLGNNDVLEETHDIYYWFYPFSMHLSAKFVGFKNDNHLACVSLLSFYPLAFMITKKSEGIFPTHARKLNLSDQELTLNLTSDGFAYAEFPFIELKGNQMMALTDFQAIVSYPIKS